MTALHTHHARCPTSVSDFRFRLRSDTDELRPASGYGMTSRPAASLVALAFAILAELAALAVVLGNDADPAGIRWWLVFAPLLLTAVPLVAPSRAAIASASIGLFFVPAAVAALVAANDTTGGVRLNLDTAGRAGP